MDLIVPLRECLLCQTEIPPTRRSDAKYCTKDHQLLANQLRRKKEKIELHAEDTGALRRGSVYKSMLNEGYAEAVLHREMTGSAVAEILGVTRAAVSKAMGAYRQDEARKQASIDWKMDPTIAAMFPYEYFEELEQVGIDAEGTVEFERLVDRIAEAHWNFQHRYYTIGSRQRKLIVKPFHIDILRELIITFVFGEKSLVETPPRHGKTEVIIRWLSHLLVMWPNLQLLWVGANTDLAGQALTKIKGFFQFNEQLRHECLAPGRRFGDDRAPKWNENEITLYTRTDRTLKSPSLTALGSTSTVAGRDADYIVIDDLEERKTVGTSELREKSRMKHNEIMERKEEHTGVMTIESRQHIDDIPSHLQAAQGAEAWRYITYPAHADWCDLDPDVVAGHDHNGCVLFPEVRSYRWLMARKQEAEDLGLPGRYELRYLQKAVPTEGTVFDIPLIREKCLNRSRGIGTLETEGGKLIAGIDPGKVGHQRCVLWMWTPRRIYLIDIQLDGSGIDGMVAVMEEWYKKYDLWDWVFEDNSLQDQWLKADQYLDMLKRCPGLNVQKHTTGKNKHDPATGLTSMAASYHEGRFDLPFGTPEAIRKVNLLLGELELWTTDGFAKRGRTDIKMASWFPWPRMQKWVKAEIKKVVVHRDGDMLGTNYPSSGLDNLTEVPW